MINTPIFYHEMPKYLLKDPAQGTAREALNYIYFDGESAFATDSNIMAIVKDYPVDKPHFETDCGARIETQATPLNYKQVLINKEDSLGVYECGDAENLSKNWRKAFDFCSKSDKAKKLHDRKVFLQKQGTSLYIYSLGWYYKTKIELLDNLPQGNDWEGAFHPKKLMTIMEFLTATSPEKFSFFVHVMLFNSWGID